MGYGNQCLRTNGRVVWNDRIRNIEVRYRILGKYDKSIDTAVNLQLKWLRRVSRMSDRRLPKWGMLDNVEVN